MENEIIAKLNKNTIEEQNTATSNYNNIDFENVYNKNSSKGKFTNNVIFPHISIKNTKNASKFNNELNDRDKENSTFQETRSIELIDKSGIYNTVKSEKSNKSINNYNNYNGNSQRKTKKHFKLYTNSSRDYNLAVNYDLNPIGNTFVTFPNQKLTRNENLQQQQNKYSPIISKEFQTNKNEERLIKKIYESNLNTSNTTSNYYNPNEKGNVLFSASDKREFEKVIIKEKKDANDPIISKQYCNISSFENKLNSELGKLSRNYGKIESKGKFTNDLLEKYIDVIPNYDKYRIVKILNNKENYKFKLLPMVINKKNGFEKLGIKFFENLKNNDPEYYDINKEWDEYLTKVKDSKIEEENKLNNINFDFSKDYKNIYEEEQSNLEDKTNDIKYLQAEISSNKFFDAKNHNINKDKNIEVNKISIEKYSEN